MKKNLNESLFSYVLDTILGYAAKKGFENDPEFRSYLKKTSDEIEKITKDLEQTVNKAKKIK